MYTNTLFIGQSYMKRRNGEKEKKIRDDCMIIVVVQLRKRTGREREKEKREKRWGETDAKLTSLNISYQREKKMGAHLMIECL
jgi:hypothetical protein